MKNSGHANPSPREISWDELDSVGLLIEGSNFTSRVPIDGGDEPMQIVQISETGIWVDMPAQSCSVGHTLELRIFAQYRKKTPDLTEIEPITVTGVVDNVVSESVRRMCIALSFRQFAPDQWQKLLSVFADKQDSINRLIQRTRR